MSAQSAIYHYLKPLIFRFDAERMHDLALNTLNALTPHPGLLRLCDLAFNFRHEALEQRVMGLDFPNPIILAAGLDKHAKATTVWQHLGFGGVEIGSVTALAQEGNPKPRLFRLRENEAIINRFGFNNEGADVLAAKIAKQRTDLKIPLGINIGKSKLAPLDKASEDYLYSLERLWALADYLVINVSSPNTQGLRQLQDKGHLDELLGALTGFLAKRRPLVLKIAPDLSFKQIDDILELVQKYQLEGLIATNTTLSREGLRDKTLSQETGGLSGKPLAKRSREILSYLTAQKLNLPIISVGGLWMLMMSMRDWLWERAWCRFIAGISIRGRLG
ncbi:MAG: quinone-dependent dihydroorotate dehydrogenase [Deinococcales bacterium]